MNKLSWICITLITFWAMPATAQVCTEETAADDCPDGWTCEMTGAGGSCPTPACDPDGECPPPDPDCGGGDIYECVPPPCEVGAEDDGCEEDERCVELESSCPSSGGAHGGGSAPAGAGTAGAGAAGDAGDPSPDDTEECVPETFTLCMLTWEAPCEQDSDCGPGFTCLVDDEYCELDIVECTPDTADDDCGPDLECDNNPHLDCDNAAGGDNQSEPAPAGGAGGAAAGGAAGSSGDEPPPDDGDPPPDDADTDCATGDQPTMICVPANYTPFYGPGGEGLGAPVGGTPQGTNSGGAAGDGASEADDTAKGVADEGGGDSGCAVASADARGGSSPVWLALAAAMLVTRGRLLLRH